MVHSWLVARRPTSLLDRMLVTGRCNSSATSIRRGSMQRTKKTGVNCTFWIEGLHGMLSLANEPIGGPARNMDSHSLYVTGRGASLE